MREKLLVLAKASPEPSKKYEELICIAGITDTGAWRRIYPVPWEVFWPLSKTKFKKKQWIEYGLESNNPSDHRPESRKINYDSISVLREAPFKEIKPLLSSRLSSVDILRSKGQKVASLCVVKPEILDFKPVTNQNYRKILQMTAQKTLFGNNAYRLDPPEYKYQCIFKDYGGKIHKLLCEDWEVERLYSNCKRYYNLGKYSSIDEVHRKVKEKILRIYSSGELYFIIGTHYRYGTAIIVGLVYPKKRELSDLK